MQSNVEIANAALRLVGSATISDLNEGTVEANEVVDIFHITRRELITQHPWHFSTKFDSLAAQSTDPIFKWDKFYTYPADCLRLFKVNNCDKTDYQVMLNASGIKSIACNVSSPLKIEYGSDVEDPTLFSQGFVMAFIGLLALKLAYPITSSKTLQKDMYVAYHGGNGIIGTLTQAKAINAQERQQRTERSNARTPWEQARL